MKGRAEPLRVRFDLQLRAKLGQLRLPEQTAGGFPPSRTQAREERPLYFGPTIVAMKTS